MPWIQFPGGGINTSDGWTVVQTPGSVLGGGAQFEGDACAQIRATVGVPWPYTPYGLLRRDFSPAIDVSDSTQFRYRWKWITHGDNQKRPTLWIKFWSNGLAAFGEHTSLKSNPGNADWQNPFTFVRPPGPTWSAIERIEITYKTVDNVGFDFIQPVELLIDDLQRFVTTVVVPEVPGDHTGDYYRDVPTDPSRATVEGLYLQDDGSRGAQRPTALTRDDGSRSALRPAGFFR